MDMVKLSYQIMGIGKWTEVYVSKDVANALVREYRSYNWPVRLREPQPT
ncbi:hypothetical protein VISI1226_00635 [Vibrio sinaloensis DSM 21326]|uniref:Uncharacterized protein n=1 Tax=Vibrio sinaloensis DSM 21326 TaxID=945550 RepID=E8M676_PHOS4|nr:hypothetical protein [Vibrio sinaloensis]EGA70526.1 hypothetical protein VISI1226_00635 [Vibrio sinaloensis DSM 21326]MDN3683399.1 hypothetical protein [Vibrio sinaloensis]